MPPRRANALGVGSAETPGAGSEFVNESPDRAGWPRRPPRKARRRVIAVGYGEEEQRRAAGCIGRPATGGDSFTDSEPTPHPLAHGSARMTPADVGLLRSAARTLGVDVA